MVANALPEVKMAKVHIVIAQECDSGAMYIEGVFSEDKIKEANALKERIEDECELGDILTFEVI